MCRIETVITTACVLFLLSTSTYAQGYAPRSETWEFALAPYYWAIGMDGDIEVKGVKSTIDYDWYDELDPTDNFATQIHFEAKKDNFAFIVEPTYVRAEDDSARVGSSRADVEVDYLMTDLLVGYGFSEHWELLAGLRLMAMDNTIDVGGGPRVSDTEDWIDLVGGVRFTSRLSEKWSFLGRFDISGLDLGSGSDFTWNGAALFFWDFAPNTSFTVGYRILDIQFDSGSGASKFEFDVRQHGPLVGVNFRWPRK
jgi:opacity protein-like surface antigen